MRNRALEHRLEDLFSDELPLTDPDRAHSSLEDALAAAFEPTEVDQDKLGQLFAQGDLFSAPELDETSPLRSDVDSELEPEGDAWNGEQTIDAVRPAAASETAAATGPDGQASTQGWAERLRAAWRVARGMLLPLPAVEAQGGLPVASTPAEGARSTDGIQLPEDGRVALQRKVKYLQLGLEIAKIAELGLGLQASLDRVVRLVQERLDTWHAAIFVLAEESTYAIQQALAGRADPSEVEKRRLLSVAADPVLAHCVESGEPWMCSTADRSGDATESTVAAGILLPQSRCGVVLPLIWGEEPLGVLTLQDIVLGAFGQEDLSDLTSVASQVTLLISHTHTSEEIARRLRQVDALERDEVRVAWDRFLPTRSRTQYEYSPPGVDSPQGKPVHELERALSDLWQTSFEQQDGADGLPLVSPISLRDQIIGVLGLEGTPERPWTEDETKVVSAVSEQLGLVLENARLFENAQRRAERERQVREITARMRESLDVETVLRIAAEEIYQALDLEEIVIQLGTGDVEGGLP